MMGFKVHGTRIDYENMGQKFFCDCMVQDHLMLGGNCESERNLRKVYRDKQWSILEAIMYLV